MLLRLILWHLKKIGANYTIETKNHTYINYPNAKFGMEPPKEILHVSSNGSGAMGITNPEHSFEIKCEGPHISGKNPSTNLHIENKTFESTLTDIEKKELHNYMEDNPR